MYRFLFLVFAFLLSGCGPRPLYVHPSVQNLEPVMQVFVAPKNLVDTRSQKALIQWANVSEEMAPAYSSTALTQSLQDIFLQHRVFLVTALPSEKNMDGDNLMNFASQNGFDYVIHATVPTMIIPAGNTPGWAGLDLNIQSVRSGVTVWHIYGEVNLVPEPGAYGIFRDIPPRPAPTATQGFTAICRAAAEIILGRTSGITVQQNCNQL